jgi:hypothetical protein
MLPGGAPESRWRGLTPARGMAMAGDHGLPRMADALLPARREILEVDSAWGSLG